MNFDKDVVVIGAGVSGLTAAFLLSRQGFRVEVLEASPRPGGVIETVKGDGFLYERGPNSVLDTHTCIGELLEKLGIAGERIDASAAASRRYVVRNGRLNALPTSPPAFLRTPLFSVRGKLRLLREPFIPAFSGGEEESVSAFVRRRLGSDILDYAIEPFVAGVYAGNPDELAVAAAFPKLHALEQRYGSLIKGQIKGARERAQRNERGKNIARSFSFRNGVQTLTDALARAVGHIRISSPATNFERQDDTFAVVARGAQGPARILSRAVVLAVPADTAAQLIRTYVPDAARALDSIAYAPVASVACAYRRDSVAHPLDGFGFLVPRVEKRRILGSLFSSSMFDERAPEGTALLTTFLGGRRDPSVASRSQDELAATVHDELTSLVGAAGPVFTAVTQWQRAIPQYTLGHLERIKRAEEVERALAGLFLCAAYRGGVSVGDCIKSAHEVAQRVGQYLLGR